MELPHKIRSFGKDHLQVGLLFRFPSRMAAFATNPNYAISNFVTVRPAQPPRLPDINFLAIYKNSSCTTKSIPLYQRHR